MAAHVVRGWSLDSRSDFLQPSNLQPALTAAAKRRADPKDRRTRAELFTETVPVLGGRTRFQVLCDLCGSLSLADAVRVCLYGNTHSNCVVWDFLRNNLNLTELSGTTCRNRKRPRAHGGAGFDAREYVLLSRAMQCACAAYLGAHPMFAGGAKHGDVLDLCLATNRDKTRFRTTRVMVTAVHAFDAVIEFAEMEQLSAENQIVCDPHTHGFTGALRRIDLCEFAAAKRRAADGTTAAGTRPGEADVAAKEEPVIVADPDKMVREPGLHGEKGNEFLVSDAQRDRFGENVEKIGDMVSMFEGYGKKFGRGKGAGDRIESSFHVQCTKSTDGTAASQLVCREARVNGVIEGSTGAAVGFNVISKPAYLRTAGTSDYTNYPIPYAAAVRGRDGADPAEQMSGLLGDDLYVTLLKGLQDVAGERYPPVRLEGHSGELSLEEFILDLVPEQFRAGKDLIWNQVAMTGGSHSGHCGKHVDQFNWVNGLYHFTAAEDGVVDGGHTVVFERNGSGRQAAVITFANGRAIVGPFSKVEHGSTAYTGGRAILGAYVDRRIVKFCLAFEWVDGGWKERGRAAYEEKKAVFDKFVEEYGL
jgi:hypothetical protein